jgi:hypothetical protein
VMRKNEEKMEENERIKATYVRLSSIDDST